MTLVEKKIHQWLKKLQLFNNNTILLSALYSNNKKITVLVSIFKLISVKDYLTNHFNF